MLTAKREETLAALRGGADVVFQAGFFDGRFSGWADFLVRADDDARPAGQPAGPVYAVHDTKLARHAKVTALLQLAAYADQLIDLRDPGRRPTCTWCSATGPGHRPRASSTCCPVYRDRRARLQTILDEHAADAGPVAWGDERYRACLRCDVCAPEVAARRDVLLVAGVRARSARGCARPGSTTIDELAARTADVPGIAAAALATLRAQARLQVAQDPPPTGRTGRRRRRARTGRVGRRDAGRAQRCPAGCTTSSSRPRSSGTCPPPDPGDIFFDFEGDPLWVDEAGEWGLEYLFGVVEAPRRAGSRPSRSFRPFWAHDRAQEHQALLDFLAYVAERRAAHPGMHVYHYAAYEKTALLRLAGRYGVGEEEVDELLRDGVLVDLYQAVRAQPADRRARRTR